MEAGAGGTEKNRRHEEAMRALERALDAAGQARASLLDVDEALLNYTNEEITRIEARVAAMRAGKPVRSPLTATTHVGLALERAFDRMELTIYRVEAVADSPSLCSALRELADVYLAKRTTIDPLADIDSPGKVNTDIKAVKRVVEEAVRLSAACGRVRAALGEIASELNVRHANGDPPDRMIRPCAQASSEAQAGAPQGP